MWTHTQVRRSWFLNDELRNSRRCNVTTGVTLNASRFNRLTLFTTFWEVSAAMSPTVDDDNHSRACQLPKQQWHLSFRGGECAGPVNDDVCATRWIFFLLSINWVWVFEICSGKLPLEKNISYLYFIYQLSLGVWNMYRKVTLGKRHFTYIYFDLFQNV